MPSSNNFSESCYIRYTLRALLNHVKRGKENKAYNLFLNIIEPPRIPFEEIETSIMTNSQCCGCCMDYGFTTINIKCNKNYVMTGDSFIVSGTID